MFNHICLKFAVLILFSASVSIAMSNSAKEDCVVDDGITFENWQHWIKLTSTPIISEGHENSWVDIYVNGLAEDTYRSASSPYPVCAKIIKTNYNDKEGTSIHSLTIMVKMQSGYDPDWGDWWYAIYDATGTTAKKQGRLYADCIACHKAASKTDFLFSKEVMAEINKE